MTGLGGIKQDREDQKLSLAMAELGGIQHD